MNKKHIIAILIIGIVLYGCLGFFGGPAGDLDFVPSTSDSFVILKIADFMQDKDVADMYKQNTGKNLQDELAKAEAESGISTAQFNKVIIFFNVEEASKMRAGPEEMKFGIILRGTFDKNKMLETLKKNQTLTESQYEGYTLYTSSEQTQTDYAFIDEGIMVAGNYGAVKEIIDVKKGKLQSIKSNPNISRISENIDMNSMFVLAVQIPQSSKEDIPSNIGPISTESFSSTRSIGVSVGKAAEKIEIKFASFSDDAASASKVADTIDGSIKLAKGMVESGSKTEVFLKKIMVSSKGEIATMQISTDVDELKKVWNESKSIGSTQEPPITQCTLPAGFVCISYRVYRGGLLSLAIGQALGRTIKVTGVKCTMNASLIQQGGTVLYPSGTSILMVTNAAETLADPFYPPRQVPCTDEVGTTIPGGEDDHYSGKIYINYTEVETGLQRIVVGSISTKYEPS